MKWVRDLYDWVLKWSDSPYGTWALFLIAFAESSFFPVPPDVLLIALCVGRPRRALWYALVCLAGSLLGGFAGYYIGAVLWEVVGQYFFQYVPGFTEEVFFRVRSLYQEHAGWAIFTAGFTPIPYKIFTISAGIADIHLGVFFIASLASRSLRFFLVGGAILLLGDKVKIYIDKYFNWFASAFTVLLIGGFLVLKRIF
ncbi:MAG: DedA family protein [Bdellovibrionales bacterium]|nr:DedA family protein [Bdellovibrionales bacterium]